MEKLSEELIEIIIANTPRPLPKDRSSGYANLLSLSLVSRQFNRITEPYLYQTIYLPSATVPNENCTARIQHSISARPRLCNYVKAVRFLHDDASKDATVDWLSRFPNLQALAINMRNSRLSALVPFLRFHNVTELYLSCVEFQEIDHDEIDDWDVVNGTVTTLDLSITDPADAWELCNDTEKFARVFTNVRRLNVHSTDGMEDSGSLNGPVFRCLTRAFQHMFETTLRDFTYRYNDSTHGRNHCGIESISNNYDARAVLQQSQLEHLVVESVCLMRHGSTWRNSLLPSLGIPTTSLRTLYLRHHISYEQVAPDQGNMMYSDEAQLLARLLRMLRQNSHFPNIETITLAVFPPNVFEEVASRVVRRHGRQGEMPLHIMLVPFGDYESEDLSISWPVYNAVRDPRTDSYNPAMFFPGFA